MAQRKKTEEQRSKAVLRLQLMTDSVMNASQQSENARRKLEREKSAFTDTTAKKVLSACQIYARR